MKIFIFILVIYTVLSQKSRPVIKALPFSISTSTSLNPLGASVKLSPNTILSFAGVKDINIGVMVPNCGFSVQAYLDLTAWGSPFQVYTTNFSIIVPRFCASDFGISLPFTAICFRIDNLLIYKSVLYGSIKADVSVGVTGLQYNIANASLFDFQVGNTSSTQCYGQKTQIDCVNKGCGWCSTNGFCLDMNPNQLTDVCNFCPRCSLFTTSNIDQMKTQCLQRDSCGWCGSFNACIPGDRFGPLDPALVCTPPIPINGDVLQSSSGTWTYNQKSQSTSGQNSIGLTVFLSFLFSFLGIIFGIIFGVVGALVSIYFYNRNK